MNRARVAYCVAFLLVAMISLSALAQTETPPAQNQGQEMGHEHHGRMGNGGRMDDPQAHLDHLSQMLNLTDEQKAKIQPILQDTTKQAQQVRQDTSLSEQDRHAKMRSIHENAMAQVRSVLTPEQQAKFDDMKKQHEGMGHGKGMGHGEGMGPKSGSQQPPPPPPQ